MVMPWEAKEASRGSDGEEEVERTRSEGEMRLWERRARKVALPSLPVGWVRASLVMVVVVVNEVEWDCCWCEACV